MSHASTSPPGTRPSRNRLREHLPILLIAPSVILLVGLIAYPLVFALKNSFYFWNLQTSPEPVMFVGLANYKLVLSGPEFFPSLWNTLLLTFSGTAIEFGLGLAIALLLANRLPGMSVSRAILIMPTTIAPIVVGFLFRYMYDPSGGIITWLLTSIGIDPPSAGILGSANTSLLAVLVADVWQWTPFFAITLYAGLLSVSPDLIEAARLDGASSATILWRIKLPLIMKTALIVLILRFMQLFNTFDLVLVLTRGGPGTSSRTLGYTLYQQGLIDFNIGMASATTWLVVIIVNAIVGLYAFFAFRNWEW
ncbi:carbohydrate ABC transporter permease [Paracoccus sp. (in: a-proteobacteria)]|uniref:carbohydrate ABC transporter permease n=1 Tax=Paracoccus sp. TaxID=267 RepID=UPI003A86DA64